MLVSPIRNFSIQNQYFTPKNGVKHLYAQPDLVCFSGGNAQLFNRIRLRTAKKLYDTNFVLSGENWGKKCLSTFVLDRKTGKPVELFIQAYKSAIDGAERYELYRPEGKYCQKLVGMCWINFHPEEKIVEPWFIHGNDKSLRGIGLRCVQLAAERALMKRYKNIVFKPDDLTYNFHIGAGFDVLNDAKSVLPKSFFAQPECDDDILKSLIEALSKNMPSLGQSRQLPEDCFLFLPLNAKKDWKKIIDKQPILKGQNLEDFFYKGIGE